jgi:hypothetical protein
LRSNGRNMVPMPRPSNMLGLFILALPIILMGGAILFEPHFTGD